MQKKHIFIFITFLWGNYVIASPTLPCFPDYLSTKLIYGKVIVKISGEEIAGAEIQIGQRKIYSDLEGNFSTLIATEKTTFTIEAAVNYISYNEACFIIDLSLYTPVVIEIISK